jgi:hypothetical protein
MPIKKASKVKKIRRSKKGGIWQNGPALFGPSGLPLPNDYMQHFHAAHPGRQFIGEPRIDNTTWQRVSDGRVFNTYEDLQENWHGKPIPGIPLYSDFMRSQQMQGMHQYPRYSPISTPRPTAPKAPESSATPFKSTLPPLPRMTRQIDPGADISKMFDCTEGIKRLKNKYKFFEDAKIYGEGRKRDTEIKNFYDKPNDYFNDWFNLIEKNKKTFDTYAFTDNPSYYVNYEKKLVSGKIISKDDQLLSVYIKENLKIFKNMIENIYNLLKHKYMPIDITVNKLSEDNKQRLLEWLIYYNEITYLYNRLQKNTTKIYKGTNSFFYDKSLEKSVNKFDLINIIRIYLTKNKINKDELYFKDKKYKQDPEIKNLIENLSEMFRDGISTIKILKQPEMKNFIKNLIITLGIDDTRRDKLYDYLQIKLGGGKKPLKKKPLKKKPRKFLNQ